MINGPVYFRELTDYSKQEIIERLSICPVFYDTLEQFLLENAFLQLNKKGNLRFHYVGAIHFQECVLIIYPKYMNQTLPSALEASMTQLFQVFFKFYKTHARDISKNQYLRSFDSTKLQEDCSKILLFDFIMQDYLEHGLYLPDFSDLELNGTGEIDWPSTIELNQVLFSKNKPIYIDYYTNTNFYDENHLVHKIHQAILEEISLFFEQFSVLNLFHYPVIQSNYLLNDLGDIEFLIEALNQELQILFSDRKLALVVALLNYLKQKEQYVLSENIQLFGTDTFHVIWEAVCSEVFDNQYEYFKKWIPKPQWRDLHSEKIAEVATLIPDILIYRKEEHSFYILDAKYYTTYFDEIDGQSVNIHNNPSVGDVTKQYLYEQTLRKHNLEIPSTTQYYNLFVLPTEEASHFFGHVTFSIFEEHFKGIYLYRQNSEQLFQCYLNNKHLPTAPFNNYIKNRHR